MASAIGYAMDGFDLLILGFMLRAISGDLHLTPPQAGSLSPVRRADSSRGVEEKRKPGTALTLPPPAV